MTDLFPVCLISFVFPHFIGLSILYYILYCRYPGLVVHWSIQAQHRLYLSFIWFPYSPCLVLSNNILQVNFKVHLICSLQVQLSTLLITMSKVNLYVPTITASKYLSWLFQWFLQCQWSRMPDCSWYVYLYGRCITAVKYGMYCQHPNPHFCSIICFRFLFRQIWSWFPSLYNSILKCISQLTLL